MAEFFLHYTVLQVNIVSLEVGTNKRVEVAIMHYALIGPSLYVDERGRLYEQRDGQMVKVHDKATEAEDRYVARSLQKEED